MSAWAIIPQPRLERGYIIGVLVIGFGICVIGTTVSYSLNISLWLGLLGVAALYGSFILPPRVLTFLQHRRTLYQEERRKVEEEKREKLKKQQTQEERRRKEAEELAERRRMETEELAALAKWKEFHESKTMDDISRMTGTHFEEFLAKLVSKMGYTDIRLTPANDQGGDVLCISPSGASVVIQAKRWAGKVGNGAVQELLGAMLHYDRAEGMVVTNNSFTEAARELAQKDSRVTLRDGRWLEAQIKRFLPIEIPGFNWGDYNRQVRDYRPARARGKRNSKFGRYWRRRRY